jgi:transposase
VLCGKQIFSERFGDVLPPYARRTGRLEHLVHHLALALGGRPAARFAQRLMLPVSNDTLLRVRGQRNDVFRSRESSLETYLEWLDAQWATGKRNATELWRRMRTQGFRGSRRVVSEWATRRKRADKADVETLNRIPSARTIARLLTTSRDNLTKSETVTIAAIEGGVPLLVKARDIIAEFHRMIRRKAENELAPWIGRARDSLVASFGNGVAKDIQAVRAAIVSPWSNGQTEGQITKLKLVKRQMYGRGKLDLLQARLIGAT